MAYFRKICQNGLCSTPKWLIFEIEQVTKKEMGKTFKHVQQLLGKTVQVAIKSQFSPRN